MRVCPPHVWARNSGDSGQKNVTLLPNVPRLRKSPGISGGDIKAIPLRKEPLRCRKQDSSTINFLFGLPEHPTASTIFQSWLCSFTANVCYNATISLTAPCCSTITSDHAISPLIDRSYSPGGAPTERSRNLRPHLKTNPLVTTVFSQSV